MAGKPKLKYSVVDSSHSVHTIECDFVLYRASGIVIFGCGDPQAYRCGSDPEAVFSHPTSVRRFSEHG